MGNSLVRWYRAALRALFHIVHVARYSRGPGHLRGTAGGRREGEQGEEDFWRVARRVAH